MNTIIIATDYSAVSQNAARYAVALAKQMNASLLLYHAFYFQETYSDLLAVAPTIEELTIEHQARLEEIKKDMVDTYQLPVQCFTSHTPIDEELPRLVSEYKAAMVVMGMKKLTLFDRKVFGSVAASICNMATFPVLLIPEKASFSGYKNILFPYDFEFLSTSNHFLLLKELILRSKAQLYLVHVEKTEPVIATQQVDAKNKYSHLEDVFHEIAHQYVSIEEEDVAEGISKAMLQYQADLLVMVPQPHGFWERLFNKSITGKMAYQTTVPLLTLPNPPEARKY